MADHGRLGAPDDLFDDGGALGECRAEHLGTEPRVVETGADDGPVHAHSVHHGDGVRRGELDASLAVDEQQAVAHPGGAVAEALLVPVGELAPVEHEGEAVEHRQVGAFLFAHRPVAGPMAFTGQHGDGLVATSHRHHLEGDVAVDTDVDAALDDAHLVEALGDQRPAMAPEHLADQVSPVEGGAGGGPDVAEEHQRGVALVGLRCVEQQVGEGEVGEQAP